MLSPKKTKELTLFAIDIRTHVVTALGRLGFGHLGGALSAADVVAVLYGAVMRYDPQNPKWEDRDWFVCSKGHAGPAVYAALGMKGFFPVEDMYTINTPGTRFPSHCDRNLTPGIDMTTGSLGQGASLAVGVALGNRMNVKDSYTYLLLGDGELQEGQVWEAASYAAQQKLDHLIAFVDENKKQLDGYVRDINSDRDIVGKFESFGWNALRVRGDDVSAIYDAVEGVKGLSNARPSCIVLDTVKGVGCTFCRELFYNHHMDITKEMMDAGLAELRSQRERVVAAR